jgi:hypothetical protein
MERYVRRISMRNLVSSTHVAVDVDEVNIALPGIER